MPHYGPEVTRKVFEPLYAGKSQGEVQRLTGTPQPTISRWAKARRTNGEPASEPQAALQRVEYLADPGSPGGSPKIPKHSEVDDRKASVSVLEAFFATIQHQAAFLPGSPAQFTNGSPGGSPTTTCKRGFVMADDVWDAIHRSAGSHHRQRSKAVDQALRECFAHHGWQGQEVGRE
jgi:hypothetical protein